MIYLRTTRHAAAQAFRIGDVALKQSNVRMRKIGPLIGQKPGRRFQLAPVRQRMHDMASLDQLPNQSCPDKSACAGDEDIGH